MNTSDARLSTELRAAVATDIWHCDPNAIVCQHGEHLIKFYKTGYRGDIRRLSGHAFLKCDECSQYFLAVFSELPTPMVTCYSISKESFQQWDCTNERTPPTPELLYQLKDPEGRSYNPLWTPPRNRSR